MLIAARNEANSISRTLEMLTPQADPIVIPNGCTDQTAQVAEQYGATIIQTNIEGKMTALQSGIRYLGKRALEPFLTLDADSRPIFPAWWLGSLLKTRYILPEDEPAVVVGPIVFTSGADPLLNTYRTARTLHRLVATRNNPQEGSFAGGNMLIHTLRDEIVEEILELPQIWPGEDAVIKDVVVESGGNVRKSLNPLASIFSDSSRYPTLRKILAKGRKQTREDFRQTYLDDAPPNSITGTEYKYLRSLGRIAA